MKTDSGSNGKTYVLAACRPWNRQLFDAVIRKYEGEWHFIGAREELTAVRLQDIQPRYVFFLHWSWKVPDEIVNRYECICFHMTDVPYGRGGSPLQNLIVRGHQKTMVSALRMTHEFDAGPVYLKEPLALEGRAEDIYIRAGEVAAKMIGRIITEKIVPQPQSGEVVMFQRRKPEQSNLAGLQSLNEVYDYIRMLDAEGYPHAFVEVGPFRFEFTRAARTGDRVTAEVSITARKGRE